MLRRLPLPPMRAGDGEPTLHFGGVRLRVLAEAIPLPRFAAALSAAVGADIAVSSEALGVQVTVASPDITATTLLNALREEVIWEPDADGVVRLETLREEISRLAREQAARDEPVETVRFAPVPGLPFAQLAPLVCDQIVSPRGRVDVVSGHLVVQDVASAMPRVRYLLDALTAPPFEAGDASANGFACRGPERAPPPARVRAPPAPSGRLLVQRLALPPRRTEPREEHAHENDAPDDEGVPEVVRYAGVRLRVVAEASPLDRFAVALSEALGVGVVVPPDSLDVQVSLASSDITVDRLLRALRAAGVDSARGDTMISLFALDPSGAHVPMRRRRGCIEVPETRILPFVAGLPMDQVARYFCDSVTPDARAAYVIGGRLVAHGFPAALNRIELLLRDLAPTQGVQGAVEGARDVRGPPRTRPPSLR